MPPGWPSTGELTVRELSPWATRSGGRQVRRDWYAAYITSAEWYRRRVRWVEEETQLIPAGAGIDCLGCLKPWVLARDDLHHVDYARLGAEAHEDLWPLCRNCHTALHELMRSTSTWRKLPRRIANTVALAYLQDLIGRDETTGTESGPADSLRESL